MDGMAYGHPQHDISLPEVNFKNYFKGADAMQPIIEVKQASKVFGSEYAVNHVSASFTTGHIHGIVGRNGSGKTVLMRLIAGLYRLTAGEIRVKEQRVGVDIEFPGSMGILIEAPGFLPYDNGFRNLRLLVELSGSAHKKDIEQTMSLVGLDPCSKKHVGKYSLGMKQRLGIAQAVLENPDILLLDEPMNGLDKNGVKDMKALFLHLREQGKTILLASHNPLDIDELCDTVHEMDAGLIQQVR